jgi:hypothetical protein
MVRKGVLDKYATLCGSLLVATLLTLTLGGCGTTLLGGGTPEISSVIWKHRDQYVQIESQDRGVKPTPPNNHPANIPADQLTNILGALEVHFEDQEKPVPVFTFKELEILTPAISQGLAQATPREDVTFAILGIHRGLVSFTHDRSILTGRLFVQDGKLNLIIGRLHEEYDEEKDRRVDPWLPGSRAKSRPLPVLSKPWQVVSIPGLETKQVAGTDRQDWLVMTPDPQLWKAAIARKTEAGEAAKAALQEASQVRQESAQMSAEQERLRAEMEALKQELHTIRQTPAAVPVVSQPHQAEPTDSIKNRLRQLQDLRNENLISEDEYQAKRQEILDSL